MPDLIATIFHVTDMHLFVDESGDLRHDAEDAARLMVEIAKKVPIPKLRDLLSGGMWHNEEALKALAVDLPACVADARRDEPGSPIIVLQTGDVEALGSAAPPQRAGYEAYPSFQFVHDQLRDPVVRAGASWLDIFGNHDTWPGAYPPMRVRDRAINRERIATVPGLEGPWPELVESYQGDSGVPVIVARINTVSRTLLEETIASGAVSDHPPGGASALEVLNELSAVFAPWRDQRAVRIVVMHHPPHPFDASFQTKLTTGLLEGRDELAEVLSELRVQLVIAGHRHKLNPALEAQWVALPWRQPPLVDPTVQLVAESATQDSIAPIEDNTAYGDFQPMSFCRYRLWTGGDIFAVERTLFQYSDGRPSFSGRMSGTLFDGLPLI